MNKKLSIAAIILSIIAIALSAFSMTHIGNKDSGEKVPDIQYVLYVGTNDKDTNEPVYPPEESMEKMKSLLIKNFGGYTIQEANGGWINDEGKEYQEYTLVVYLSDTTLDDVHAVCDEAIKEFNQSSILIQANETTTEFYAGE
ncbi:MAG: hypothetical protein Q4A32_00340 [Lachnospiraceae bacterium]|nr:hypothetical protein [Lachnospiraceae bacterium]